MRHTEYYNLTLKETFIFDYFGIQFPLFWDTVSIIFALGGIFLTGNIEWIWLFGGMWAILRKLETFIDHSNRNWTMHLIDLIEEGKIYFKDEETDEDS